LLQAGFHSRGSRLPVSLILISDRTAAAILLLIFIPRIAYRILRIRQLDRQIILESWLQLFLTIRDYLGKS
jgi:hypothetical protein